MTLIQTLVSCSFTALFLGSCLPLITGQDEDKQKPFTVKIFPIPETEPGVPFEVNCKVEAELKECLPIIVHIYYDSETKCSIQEIKYKTCMCPGDKPKKFYFNMSSKNRTTIFCRTEPNHNQKFCKGTRNVPTQDYGPSLASTEYIPKP